MQKLAFVFPGQGSQSVGMMAAYGDDPAIRSTFDEASAALGEDLWSMVCDGPAERLALTTNTQPLMLTAGVAVYRSWMVRTGRRPDMVAGHSLGEYAALVAAGSLTLADAARLVRERGRLMQHSVPAGTGAMAAVLGTEDELVADVCKAVSGDDIVVPANFNSPGQVVIGGHAAAVDRAIAELQAQGESSATAEELAGNLSAQVEAFERSLISAELSRSHSSLRSLAEALGVPRKTLHDKLRKHGLSFADAGGSSPDHPE